MDAANLLVVWPDLPLILPRVYTYHWHYIADNAAGLVLYTPANVTPPYMQQYIY